MTELHDLGVLSPDDFIKALTALNDSVDTKLPESQLQALFQAFRNRGPRPYGDLVRE